MTGLIVLAVVALFFLFVAARTVRIIPQARAGLVERLGRYHRTLQPGLAIVVPFIDRVKPLIDLREQVVSFPPQPVITEDNLVVGIDTVIYFTVTDPKAATYEVANPLQAIEQLTVTHSAQRDRRHDPRGHAHLARPHQLAAASRPCKIFVIPRSSRRHSGASGACWA